MSLNEREQVEVSTLNVVSLFKKSVSEEIIHDPLEVLMEESQIEDEVLMPSEVRISFTVNENQFPDQSLYILDEQLSQLRTKINRIKFYLGELDEIIPR